MIDTENEAIEQYILQKGNYLLNVKVKHGLLTSVAIEGFTILAEDIFK